MNALEKALMEQQVDRLSFRLTCPGASRRRWLVAEALVLLELESPDRNQPVILGDAETEIRQSLRYRYDDNFGRRAIDPLLIWIAIRIALEIAIWIWERRRKDDS